MKAMILAAGKGTRMLPLTEKLPKPLIPIQGMTLLGHTIAWLKFYGIKDIIINTHHHAGQIVDYIGNNNSFGIHIEFSDETGQLLDTGGGLKKAQHFFDTDEPFVLTSSDVITDLNLTEMVRFHKAKDPLVTLAVKHRASTRDFIFDHNYRLCGWHNNITGESKTIREVEKPYRIAFSTIHVISPRIFPLIVEEGKFSIIDLYLRMASDQLITGFEHDDSGWFECGKYENLPQLNQNPQIAAIYKKYH